jgi:hypothetical protein
MSHPQHARVAIRANAFFSLTRNLFVFYVKVKIDQIPGGPALGAAFT